MMGSKSVTILLYGIVSFFSFLNRLANFKDHHQKEAKLIRWFHKDYKVLLFNFQGLVPDKLTLIWEDLYNVIMSSVKCNAAPNAK